jgi:spore coat protein U-like protein
LISYECAKQDRRIRITLSRGTSPTYVPRTMKNGSERLEYNLFTDAYATVWGDGTEGTGFYYINNPPNNRVVPLTVYGRMRQQQDVGYGLYSDTVVAQIEF